MPSFFRHYPLFRVRLLLFEPSLPFISCGWLPTYRPTTVGDMKGLLRSWYPLFEFFRACLSTGVLGCALTQLKEFVRPYPCQIFPTQEVDFIPQAYIPWFRSSDGSTTLCLFYPTISHCFTLFWDSHPGRLLDSCLRRVLSAIATFARFRPRFTDFDSQSLL